MTYKDVHVHASRVLAEGLCDVGLMKGNPADAVEAGAHALFFPHGLGHMLGLDVHDMEDLGDVVGYPPGQPRSSQFGLNFLRLSRALLEGFVLTVEPGIYFIPALIDRWQQEKLHREFINYDKLESFRGFGGIRIEDNVVVTAEGARVLGPGIPKTVQRSGKRNGVAGSERRPRPRPRSSYADVVSDSTGCKIVALLRTPRHHRVIRIRIPTASRTWRSSGRATSRACSAPRRRTSARHTPAGCRVPCACAAPR